MILVILHQIVFISAVNKYRIYLIRISFILGKGHSQAALSLWNNMLEPVGAKQSSWHLGESLKCPTEKYPYIFTNKNSAKALEEYQRSTTMETTNRTSPMSSSSSQPSFTTTQKHKHHKHHKSESDSSFTKTQFAAFAGLFFLIMMLLILGITKRQQIRVFVHRSGRRRLNGFENPQYPDDNDDDVEIWNRSNQKSNLSGKNDIPKTHGTRISFE